MKLYCENQFYKTFYFFNLLQDGTIIRGQNEISHPTNGPSELINKVRFVFYFTVEFISNYGY